MVKLSHLNPLFISVFMTRDRYQGVGFIGLRVRVIPEISFFLEMNTTNQSTQVLIRACVVSENCCDFLMSQELTCP